MADIDLKTETPDASLPATGFLFGADSQAAASPSVYTTQSVATRLLGSTTLSGTTITANAPVLDLAQTWNNAAVTFTGAKLNVTDTASNAASLLMDLQVGGTSRFNIAKTGSVSLGAGASASVSISAGDTIIFQGFGSGFGSQPVRVPSASGISIGPLQEVNIRRRAVANLLFGGADTGAVNATVTITIATPGVVTWTNHSLSTGTPVVFTTTGALPTGITAGTTYYVIAVDASTFQIATTLANALAGTAVNTSGSQSGTHTGTRYAVAQRLSVQGVTGVSNIAGSDTFIQGSQGTGTGAGGSIVFQVAPAGSSGTAQNALATALTIVSAPPSGSVTSASVALQIGAHGYISAPFGNGIELNCANANGYWVALNGHTGTFIGNNVPLGWSSTKSQTGVDLTLYRDAANTLALRNGTNAQTFNVYNTFTDASNYERLSFNWSSNIVRIGTQQAGTGSQRALYFIVGNADRVGIGAAGSSNGLNLTSNGFLLFSSTTSLSASPDLGIGRSAASVLSIVAGTSGGAAFEMAEMTAPAAPAANGVRIYAVDNGSGKTQLMALFATGAAQQIAIEP
jgi:hypothetical protein